MLLVIYLTASYDFLRSLAPMITEQPNFANYFAVSFPIPEFEPVTIATFPLRSGFGPL